MDALITGNCVISVSREVWAQEFHAGNSLGTKRKTPAINVDLKAHTQRCLMCFM
jgi:hypothetical protein